MKNSWSITQVWNKSMEEPDEREIVARDYLWASELGKPEVDVWLRMKGEMPTNPPNPRSLRKFEAGNIFESIIEVILLRAGIMQGSQERVEWQYPEMLRVSGKIDFIAGGLVDLDSAKQSLQSLYLPEKTNRTMNNIVEYLAKEYPDGLEKIAIEVKSVSSFMMNALEATNRPLAIHRLQAYHYTKHPEIEQAKIVYVCREDLRMMEIPIFADSPVIELEYKGIIEKYTKNQQSDTMPEKAKPIVFDEDMGKFTLNRMISYSPYLSKIYGYESQMEFEDKYKPIPARLNRVIKRVVDGNKMTEKNLEAIKEIEELGYSIDEIAKKYADAKEDENIED